VCPGIGFDESQGLIQKCEGTGVESGTVDYVYAVPLLHGKEGNRNVLPYHS
jgi:hypothetical protein